MLAGSYIVEIQLWGEYQSAALAFLSADYFVAAKTFGELCERHDAGRVGNRACEMKIMAEQLGQLKKEGEPYGAAAYYDR